MRAWGGWWPPWRTRIPGWRGRGSRGVAEAGIETASGVLEDQARALNPGFISRMERGRPFVRVKLAMSLDGRTAMASGESRWITGEAARRDVQRLRARAGAVLTGIGTVRADDPGLDVRLSARELGIVGEVRQPLRVVLDTRLECPPDATPVHHRRAGAGADGRTGFESRYKPLEARGAEVLPVALAGERPDLHAVMGLLAEREINELHVEAGPISAAR
jgi:diaminohydroxyphosphoribosylaminopyrimidine deaminase / 5-amino-6-(5-phosphoribosylamino)uracil reductase